MTNKALLYVIPLAGFLTIYPVGATDDPIEEQQFVNYVNNEGEEQKEKEPTDEEPEGLDEAKLYDFADIVTLNKGATAIFGTGLFRATSGLVNYTDKVKLRQDSILTLKPGDGIDRGVFHNYGRVELYRNSRITGGGTIFEHGRFGDDKYNSALAIENRKDNDSGYIVDDYDTQRDLRKFEDFDECQKATYYDLVNNYDLIKFYNTSVRYFKICYTDYGTNYYTGCGIFATSKNIEDDVTEGDFVKLTDSVRGVGDQGKIDPSIVFKTDTQDFDQTALPIEIAYDLGKLEQDYRTCESIHVSDQTDDIKASFFSIPGFLTAEPENPDGATKFQFGEGVNRREVWLPKVDDNVILGKTMPDTENAAAYEQDIMDTLNTSAENNDNLFAYKDWAGNDPVTTYHGDNSWFNGVYKLKRGAIIVKNTAGMFGGRVELGDADVYESPTGAGTGTLALHRDLVAGNEDAKNFIKNVRPTEFEWEGGAKDEYNKPDIYMNGNSTLFFNLQPDQNGNQIFSFYGNITGTERDRLIFEQGEVRIKGDCSGFKGSIAVTPGAKFEVRSSDAGSSSTYQGKFPNANIYQVYGADAGENAGKFVTNPTAVTSVDTATMENVTINNGIMELNNAGSEDGGKITLKSANIESTAMTTLNDESNIKDTVIRGVLVAKGDMNVENTTLEGGVLVLDNATLTTDNLAAGSTIASWGNDNWNDVVRIGGAGGGGGHFQINRDHTLKLFSDYNVTTGASDYINVVDPVANIQGAGGIAVAGMNFNDIPTNDTYTFKIYDGAGHTDNMPVTIGGSYNGGDTIFNVYVNGTFNATNGNVNLPNIAGGVGRVDDLQFTYNPNGSEKVTTYLDNGLRILEFNNGTIYKVEGQSAGQYGNVVMTKYLTEAAIASDIVQDAAITGVALTLGDISSDADSILNSAILSNSDFYASTSRAKAGSDTWTSQNNAGKITSVKTKKYRIWNKTFGEHSKIGMQGTDDVNANGVGTMLGFDDEESKLDIYGYNATLRPTFFFGIHHNNLKYRGDKYGVNGYFGGVKASLYDKNRILEVFGIYEYLKNGATVSVASSTSDQRIKTKSHVFNFGAKYALDINVEQNLYFRPSLALGYAFICNPSFTGYNKAKHKLNNRHVFSVVPEIGLIRKYENWFVRGFASYHRRFGTKGKTKATGISAKTDISKKRFLEYGAEIIRTNVTDTANFSVKLSRKTLGIRGFKLSISAGLKF